MKKLIALVMLLALVMTAFAGCSNGGSSKSSKSGNSTYEEALESYVEVFYGSKTPSKAEVKALRSSDMWACEDMADFDEMYEDALEQQEGNFERLSSMCGENYDYTIKITDKIEMDEGELEEGREEFNEVGLKGNKLTKAYVLELYVDFATEGSSDGYRAEGEARIIQYNGSWYVLYLYLDLYN